MPRLLLLILVMLIMATACNTKHEVQVAPVEVKPIHITIDVNIKVDRALEDFFGDLDEAAETSGEVQTPPAATTR